MVTRKDHETRKQEMVDAALELAAEEGVQRTSTQAIAKRVGIAHATVFRHFPNRSALFQSALQWIARGLFAAMGPLLEGSGPADWRLRKLIERQLGFIGRHRGIPRLLFSEHLHLDDPTLKREVREVLERYAGRVADLIREGQAQGRFRTGMDPEEAGRLVAAMIQGVVLQWSLYEFESPLESRALGIIQMLDAALGVAQASAGQRGERDELEE